MNVLQAAQLYQAELRARDTAAMLRIVRMYQGVVDRLNPQIRALSEQIQQARDSGQQVNAAWVEQQAHWTDLRRLVLQEMAGFAQSLNGDVSKAQRAVIAIALREAESLTRASVSSAATMASWVGLDPAAVEAMLGATLRGPLEALLRQIAPDAVEDARKALVESVALSENPRKTATSLRKALGVSMNRALTIARTETLRAHRLAAVQAYQANPAIISGWTWLSAMDSRTCFPAGTLVDTLHGQRPIESIRIGDLVLTHTGNYQPVTGAASRRYVGDIVSVAGVKMTSDHPVLAEREGELDWVEACEIRRGDKVYRRTKSAGDVLDHSIVESPVHRCGGEPNDAVSELLKMQGLISVAFSDSTMPVGLVDLKGDPLGPENEVYGATPARDDGFLLVLDPKSVKGEPSVGLGDGFTGMSAVAPSRTEPSSDISGADAELPLAGYARHGDDRSPTFLGAVATVRVSDSEDDSAPDALLVESAGALAGERAVDISVSVAGGNGEVAQATRARLGYASRSLSLGGSLLALGESTTSDGAILTAAAPDPRRLALEKPSALDTSTFHSVIISKNRDVTSADLVVYDIEVDTDHSFVAEGLVVHNCPVCWAMQGSVHPASEPFASHPNCRCTPVPLTHSWHDVIGDGGPGIPEIGGSTVPSGADRFAALPSKQQLAILGPGAYAAYKDGTPLSAFVGYRSSPYGPTLYRKSLRSIGVPV